MKKFAIGCLSVFGILFVAGGIILYMFVLRPAQSFISNVQQFEQVETDVKNRMSFSPPESSQLSEEQVERFMAVQAQMFDSLEGRAGELERKFEDIEARLESQNREAGIREIVSAWQEIAELAVAAKRAQVDALNGENFSLQEYNWVREQVYLAAGIAGYQLNLADLAKAAQGGDVPELPEELADVPEENISLLEPYKEQLKKYSAFAVVGL